MKIKWFIPTKNNIKRGRGRGKNNINPENKVINGEKMCTKEGVMKPVYEFYIDKRSGLYYGYCKICHKSYTKNWIKKHEERNKEYQKQYQKTYKRKN